MGHEVLTVNVPPREIRAHADWKDYIKTLINLGKRLGGRYYSPFLNPHTFQQKERELSFNQRNFITKHISKVDEKSPFDPSVAKKHNADAWIVGSDQVWRPWCSPDIKNYFFDFLSYSSAKKIAYAVSFGTDIWEIDESTTKEIKILALKFDAVSVREAVGVELCDRYLGVEATHVLDPTMLLTKDDYDLLIDNGNSPMADYAATYLLDPNREKRMVVKEECRKYSLEELPIGRMHKTEFDSIESWLAGIRNAKMVITDSFHGTVFSLIYGVPVRFLSNSLRGNSRFDSLIQSLCLEKDAEGYYRIDKESQSILDSYIESSLNYLIEALS